MAIKVGVIGCGYWGPNLIRNFSQIEETDMYCICDLDEKKMSSIKKTYPTVRTTGNYNDIINDPCVDAVVISTPVFSHFELAKKSLLHNKHVLIEKPMTSTVSQAEELIRLAKEKNRTLMVDHTFVYAQAIIKMKEIIKTGEIGRMYYIRAEWLNLGLLQPDVNVIWDLATHISSIVYYVVGTEPISLNANAGAYVRKDIPEIAHLHIKFPDNITVYVIVSWLEPKKTRTVTVVGDKKTLVYDLTNQEEQIKVYDRGVDLTKISEDVGQLRVNYRYGDIHSPNIKNIEPLQAMCSHFTDCILNNKNPVTDGRAGLNVVKILEAAEQSLKNNGKEIILK